jgi:hypothetical protein
MQEYSCITAREKKNIVFGIQDIVVTLMIYSPLVIYIIISFFFADQPRSKTYMFLFRKQVSYKYSAALAGI